MSSTADVIRNAAAAVSSGSAEPAGGSTPSDDSESYVYAGESTQDVDLGSQDESGDTPTDSVPEEQASSEPTPSKEVITISDENGRRKIEVDFNNRDQLKKYVQMAHGARKWQAERDQARQEIGQVQKKFEELRTNWDVLEKTFQQSGVEGVIDLLEGRPGASKAWLAKQLERQRFLEEASPEELKAFEASERADREKREAERLRKEFEELKKQVSSERDEADLKAVEARIHPVFHKYSFSDKLGNEVHEGRLNKMLWTNAMEALEPLEEQYGHANKIPPEMVEKIFRDEARELRTLIGKQADRVASKALEKKKQEATENVQAHVQSGYRRDSAAQEAKQLMDNGDLKGIFRNWGKYSSSFRKK